MLNDTKLGTNAEQTRLNSPDLHFNEINITQHTTICETNIKVKCRE